MLKEIEIFKRAFEKPLPGVNAQLLMSPSVRFTGNIQPNQSEARASSVLVLIYEKDGEWYVPLIQRATYEGAHSGQVSFPGGKAEEGDISYLDTALRESEEELGINRNELVYIGSLTPLYIPNSNFMVYPQVCVTSEIPVFIPDLREVDSVIEAPVNKLLSPQTIHMFTQNINGNNIDAPFYNIDNYVIWGATAMIMSEFLEIIKDVERLSNPSPHSYNECNVPKSH